MAEVIAAVEQEYRKLGRLVLEREFGDYYRLTRSCAPAKARRRCPPPARSGSGKCADSTATANKLVPQLTEARIVAATTGGMAMHQHEPDEHRDSFRPKAARIDDELSGQFGQAAAAGRTDALGVDGVLGLQRTAGNAGVTSILEEERSPVHDVVKSGGRPLDTEVRTDMEARLGHDFSDVRVHDDSAAQASATAVNAHAYTVGPNIVFQRDRYDPSSHGGQDHAGPRADPRDSAAQRAGRWKLGAGRDQGVRPVRSVRA